MNCHEIVKDYLIKNGYDGLFHLDIDCACEIADLQPCSEDMSKCKPGYKIQCTSDEYDWRMAEKKVEIEGEYNCSICEKEIQDYSISPGRWGVALPYIGGEGKQKYYHIECLVKLIEEKTIKYKPIETGDSNGVQFLCSHCEMPPEETLLFAARYCWNCGVKLDWSEWEK